MIRPGYWLSTRQNGVVGLRSRSPRFPNPERVRLDMLGSLTVGSDTLRETRRAATELRQTRSNPVGPTSETPCHRSIASFSGLLHPPCIRRHFDALPEGVAAMSTPTHSLGSSPLGAVHTDEVGNPLFVAVPRRAGSRSRSVEAPSLSPVLATARLVCVNIRLSPDQGRRRNLCRPDPSTSATFSRLSMDKLICGVRTVDACSAMTTLTIRKTPGARD